MTQHFGIRLAEARKRRGLSLEQVNIQLRISPAILDSLERADFYHMPLKGHARNMVSAYARFLGLDSNELTKQFLREYHDFENHVSRSDSAPSAALGYGDVHHSSGAIESRVTPSPRSNRADSSQGFNSMWNKPIPRSELGRRGSRAAMRSDQDYASTAAGVGSNAGVSREYSSRSYSAQDYQHRSYAEGNHGSQLTSRRRVHGTEGTIQKAIGVNPGQAGSHIEGGYGLGSYSAKPSLPMRLFGSLFNNPIALVVVLILILVLLFAVWAIAANSCKAATTETLTPKPAGSVVSGDGSSTDANTATTPVQQEAVDESFELVVKPAAGTGPYTSVTVDGKEVFAMAAFEEEMTWQVKESCKIRTAQVENLTVTKDGETVTLEPEGDGFASVTLNAKEEANANATSSGATSGTSGTSGSGSSDGTASGSGSDSSGTTGSGDSASNTANSTNASGNSADSTINADSDSSDSSANSNGSSSNSTDSNNSSGTGNASDDTGEDT